MKTPAGLGSSFCWQHKNLLFWHLASSSIPFPGADGRSIGPQSPMHAPAPSCDDWAVARHATGRDGGRWLRTYARVSWSGNARTVTVAHRHSESGTADRRGGRVKARSQRMHGRTGPGSCSAGLFFSGPILSLPVPDRYPACTYVTGPSYDRQKMLAVFSRNPMLACLLGYQYQRYGEVGGGVVSSRIIGFAVHACFAATCFGRTQGNRQCVGCMQVGGT